MAPEHKDVLAAQGNRKAFLNVIIPQRAKNTYGLMALVGSNVRDCLEIAAALSQKHKARFRFDFNMCGIVLTASVDNGSTEQEAIAKFQRLMNRYKTLRGIVI